MSQAEVDITDVHELASLLQTGKMSDVEVLLQQISEVFVFFFFFFFFFFFGGGLSCFNAYILRNMTTVVDMKVQF